MARRRSRVGMAALACSLVSVLCLAFVSPMLDPNLSLALLGPLFAVIGIATGRLARPARPAGAEAGSPDRALPAQSSAATAGIVVGWIMLVLWVLIFIVVYVLLRSTLG